MKNPKLDKKTHIIDSKNYTLDHIAYAVKSTDKAIGAFRIVYPMVAAYKILEPSQNVFITYLTSKNSNYRIELVEGARHPNPVENLATSTNSSIYHICFRVKNFEETAKYFKKQGLLMINGPFETALEKRTLACHFFHPDWGIIEIMGK